MELLLTIISFFSAFLCRALSLLDWFVIHDHKNNVYRHAMQFFHVSLQLASIFLILFSNETFSIVKGIKKGRKFLITYALISKILILSSQKLKILDILTHEAAHGCKTGRK
ncbi:hypothetical protein GF325_18575 [Candidatus Bathyarchaeota archaeon]|nr:hypothetical protein [Candidatus Bathyarchaeota archaeon]